MRIFHPNPDIRPLSIDNYDLMEEICQQADRLKILQLLLLKSGEIQINPTLSKFNGKLFENDIIPTLQSLPDVKNIDVRKIMYAYDYRVIPSPAILNKINKIGFNDVEFTFKGILITFIPDTNYTMAVTVVEIVGENANSIYTALELIK